MSFKTVLSEVGHKFAEIFQIGEKVALQEQPLVDKLFPEVAPIYNIIVAEIGTIEAVASSVGAQSGTGATKLNTVIEKVTPSVVAEAVKAGLQEPVAADITNAVNGLTLFLNAFKPKS